MMRSAVAALMLAVLCCFQQKVFSQGMLGSGNPNINHTSTMTNDTMSETNGTMTTGNETTPVAVVTTTTTMAPMMNESTTTTSSVETNATTTTTAAPTTTTSDAATTTTTMGMMNDTMTTTTMAPTGASNDTNTEQTDPRMGYSHMKYTALVCEGNSIDFVCPEGYMIQVTNAFWGRSDSNTCANNANDAQKVLRYEQTGVTNYLYRMCAGKSKCSVSATTQVFGEIRTDYTPFYLTAEFYCTATIYRSMQCEGDGKQRISCPSTKKIQVAYAVYGRQNRDMCNVTTRMNNDSCTHPLALATVQALCDGRASCQLAADSTVFTDPCNDTSKYLMVDYTCEACTNSFGDDAWCEYWANRGDCVSNPGWMMPYCRKACTRCDDQPPVCVNYQGDQYCDLMAANGTCSRDPNYMYAFCKKSCLQCDKKTPCANKMTDESCDSWMSTGECVANTYFMLPNCTKSCFGCSDIVRCENKHTNETECEMWALNGECQYNPGFMIPYCLKSCVGCDKDPVCKNEYADYLCEDWARTGECENNAVWMHKNCWKSCLNCQAAPVCENAMSTMDECDARAMNGECGTSDLMLKSCYLSCTRCMPTYEVNDCRNKDDDMVCDGWANINECAINPGYMLDRCRKSCTKCNSNAGYISYIGGSILPGDVHEDTAGQTYILPFAFTYNARLSHFNVFFAGSSPVYLQVWRYINTTFYLVYSQKAVPQESNIAQTVKITGGCLSVNIDDRIGFTSFQEPSPVAYNLDIAFVNYPVFRRTAGSENAFEEARLPYKFSLSAVYNEPYC